MNLNRAFGIRLTTLLNEKNISKYKLEKQSGLSHSALRNIFNEINNDVKFSTIAKVCSVLGISLKEFFDDSIFEIDNLDID